MIGCSEGGTSIEDLAEKFPDKIVKIPVDVREGLTDAQVSRLPKGTVSSLLHCAARDITSARCMTGAASRTASGRGRPVPSPSCCNAIQSDDDANSGRFGVVFTACLPACRQQKWWTGWQSPATRTRRRSRSKPCTTPSQTATAPWSRSANNHHAFSPRSPLSVILHMQVSQVSQVTPLSTPCDAHSLAYVLMCHDAVTKTVFPCMEALQYMRR